MKRYLTTYTLETDKVQAFDESEKDKAPWNTLSDFVWQFANSAEEAKEQHFKKLALWENNPNKDTY